MGTVTAKALLQLKLARWWSATRANPGHEYLEIFSEVISLYSQEHLLSRLGRRGLHSCEVEAGGSGRQGHAHPPIECQARVGYLRPCLNYQSKPEQK